jgi:opacity protein-like surface antigen
LKPYKNHTTLLTIKFRRDMMQVRASLKLLCVAMLVSSVAGADSYKSKFYARAGIGLPTYRKVSGENVKARFKPIYNIAAGWNCSHRFSGELELGYLALPVKARFHPEEYRATTKSLSILANMIARLNHQSLGKHKLQPFIGAGLGYVYHRSGDLTGINTMQTSNKISGLGYQILMGIEWAARPNVSVVLDARWIDLGKMKWSAKATGPIAEFRLKTQTITLGAKFNF